MAGERRAAVQVPAPPDAAHRRAGSGEAPARRSPASGGGRAGAPRDGRCRRRAADGEPACTSTATPPAEPASDVDGARLIALNMALNGESREDADRYLAENFQLADRAQADRRGLRGVDYG